MLKEGITQAEKNLILLQNFLPKDEKIYTWCYKSSGEYVASYCPATMVHPLEKAFEKLGALEKAKAIAASENTPAVKLIGSSVGMEWAVTFEAERSRDFFFVIGPVFYTQPDPAQLENSLYTSLPGYANVSWIRTLNENLNEIPVMPYGIFARYVLMIHNSLTNQQAGMEILHEQDQPASSENTASARNRMQVRQNEQALLAMVREGNINYHDALQASSSISPGVPVHGRDPLRQMKTSVIVFTTLVTRAAMDGGLSPEIAYPLGDSYIQQAEDCHDSGELGTLAHAMYHDFIYRVHYARSNPNHSHVVQKCCDYIDLNTNRRLNAKDLASLVGYTEYYLTDKFKKETGISLSNYIRNAKISRAKILLTSTSLPVSEISDQLAFNTPNYFIQCFRKCEGCTPAQYRKKNKNA